MHLTPNGRVPCRLTLERNLLFLSWLLINGALNHNDIFCNRAFLALLMLNNNNFLEKIKLFTRDSHPLFSAVF